MQELAYIEVHWEDLDGMIQTYALPLDSPIPRIGDNLNVVRDDPTIVIKHVVGGNVINVTWTLGSYAGVVIELKSHRCAKRDSHSLYADMVLDHDREQAMNQTHKDAEAELVYV